MTNRVIVLGALLCATSGRVFAATTAKRAAVEDSECIAHTLRARLGSATLHRLLSPKTSYSKPEQLDFLSEGDRSAVIFAVATCLSPKGCQVAPCLHEGTCTDMTRGEVICRCAVGWGGARCEIDIDECASSPCQNGGLCTDMLNSYVCTCGNGKGKHAGTSEWSPESMMMGAGPVTYPTLPAGQYAKPTHLDLMSESKRAAIHGFAVGKDGYGEVKFDVEQFRTTDVRNLDLRKVIVWTGSPKKMTSVTLYPPSNGPKPEWGTELNKPATVTLFFDNTKKWAPSRVKRELESQGVKFRSYNPSTGKLVFQVQSW